jgi:hypothetical protein
MPSGRGDGAAVRGRVHFGEIVGGIHLERECNLV